MSLRQREYTLESLEQRVLLSGEGLAPLAPLLALSGPLAGDMVFVNDQAGSHSKVTSDPAADALVDTTPATQATTVAQPAVTPAPANPTPAPVSVTPPSAPAVSSAADFSVMTLTSGNGPPASGSSTSSSVDDLDPPFGGFNFTGNTQSDADSLFALFNGDSTTPFTFNGTAEKQDGALKLTGSFAFAKSGSVFTAGFTNVTGELKAGGVTLNLTISEGAFTVIGNLATPATGGVAGYAHITDASLSGVGGGNSFIFSLTNVNLSLNTTGADAAADILVGSDHVTFNYAGTTQHNFIQAAGTMALTVGSSAVSVKLSGDFGFELKTVGGASTLTFGLAGGKAELTVGGVTLAANGLSGAFLINSTGVAGWATVGTISATGLPSGLTFTELSGVRVDLNTTGNNVATSIPVGSGSNTISYSGASEQNFFRVTGTVAVNVGQGGINAKIKGTVTFDRSTDALSSTAIIRVGIVNAASSFAAGSSTLDITGINGAFIINSAGFAGQATVGGIELHGIAGLTFQLTNVLFQINTTDGPVHESIATGSTPIILDFTAPDHSQDKFFKVSGNVNLGIALGGVAGSVSGAVYFEQFTLNTTQVVKFALADATATFTAGSITATVSHVTGGFIINQDGVAGFVHASDAGGVFAVAGITGVTVSATALDFSLNTTGHDAAATFEVGSQHVDFNYTVLNNEGNFVRAGGTVDLGLSLGAVSVTVSGSLAFESATITDPVSSAVSDVVKIGGSGLTATATIAGVQFNISGVEGIVVLTNNGAAGRLKIGHLAVQGITGFTLNTTDFALEFNNTGLAINAVLKVGAVDQPLDYQDPAELSFFRGSGTATIGFSSGAFTTTLTGTFGFEQFTLADASSAVKFAFTDVSFSVGFGAGATDPRLVISQTNGFFLFSHDGTSGANTYAGRLEVGHASLENVTGLTLDVGAFTFEVNTTGRQVHESITRPGGLPAFTLDFGADKMNFLALGGTVHLGIALGGLTTTLTGTFYFEMATLSLDDGTGPHNVTTMKVSVASASFDVSAGSITLSATNINGAFLIEGNGTSAGQLSIGHLGLTGISGLTFTVDHFFLQFNNTSGAVDVDIPVPGGSPVHLDYTDPALANFVRVGGELHLALTVGSFSTNLHATFLFEQTATEMKIGIKDGDFSIAAGSIAFNVTAVNGAFVVYDGGKLAADLTIGHVALTGISGFIFTVDDFFLKINNTGHLVHETLTFGDGSHTDLDFAGDILALGGELHLALTVGSFSTDLHATFLFEQTATEMKIGIKDGDFSIAAGSIAFNVTAVNGAFVVYDGGKLAADLTIGHVALTGITGFVFTVDDFFLKINNTGHLVHETLTFGDGSHTDLDFAGDILALGGELHLSLTVGSFSTDLHATFLFEQTATEMKIGIKNGDFSIAAGSIAFNVTAVNGAFVVYDGGRLAADLTIGHVGLTGITGFIFTVDDFFLKINNTGHLVHETLTFGDGSHTDLDFAGDILALGGELHLGLTVGSFSTNLHATFLFEQTATEMKIGIKDGDFSIAAGSIAFNVTAVNGAFVVYDGGKLAADLTIGHVGLTGITGFIFTVDDFFLKINNTGHLVHETLTFGDGSHTDLDFAGDILALGGELHLALTVGSFSTNLHATFLFEQTATEMKIGIKNGDFSIAAGSIAFNITAVNGAFVVYDGGKLAADLTIGHVGLTGITGFIFTVDDFFLKINNTGHLVHETLTFGDGSHTDLDFAGDILALGGELHLGLTIGSFSTDLHATFLFEQTATEMKIGIKNGDFSIAAGSVAFNVTAVNGAFVVYDGGKLAADLTVGHVGLTGITGFIFTVDDFFLKINNTGHLVHETLTFGDGSHTDLDFAGDILALGGTLHLGLTVGSFSAEIHGTFLFEQTATEMKIGLKDAGLTIAAGSVSFIVDDMDGAFVVYDGGKLAAQLSISAVHLDGITGFIFHVDNFNFQINNTGHLIHETLTFGDGSHTDLDYSTADRFDFIAIGGALHLELHLASFTGTLGGNFYFERATINSANVFKVSVTDASFSIAFSSVTFSITQINGAFLINDHGSAGKLTVGHAALTGLPVTLTVTGFSLQFNTTGDDVVADIPVNGGPAVHLSFTGTSPDRHNFFLISGSMSITFSTYLTLTATNVVVDTGATGTQHVFEAASLGGTLDIPTLGAITVTAQNLALTAQGKFDNLTPTSHFIVSVDFSGGAGPAGSAFKWPTWLPIKISHLELNWADLGNHPDQFILVLSAAVDLPAIAGISISGEVKNLAIDVGRLVAGDFPIIGFDSAGLAISGTLFGTLDLHAALIVGMIKLDASDHEITDPLTFGVHTVFYAGISGGAELLSMGVGVDVRVGIAAFDSGGTTTVVPLEAFIKVDFPLLLEPISGLTLGSFTAGIQFNHVLADYTDPMSLKPLTIAGLTNPDLTHWDTDLRASALGIYLHTATPGATGSVWDLPMTITAGAEFYSSYISKQALDANVLFQIDTTGKILLIGELTTGGGNLKLAARFFADYSHSGTVKFSFYADAGLAGVALPGGPPFSVWGKLTVEVLSSTGTIMVGDPDNPTALDGTGTTVKIAFSGGSSFLVAGGALTVKVTGDVDIQITSAASVFITKINFDAAVRVIAPVGNPLDYDFAQISGAIVLKIYTVHNTTSGADDLQFELYGAVKLIFNGQGLKQYGLDVNAEIFAQINTTAFDHTVTLTYTDHHTEDITITHQSFSLYIVGHVGLGTPADPTTHFLEADGILVLQIDANGLTIFVDVTIDVGPSGSPLLQFAATGFLRVNLSGIAARLDLTLVSNLPASSGLEFNATFQLELNTTKADIVYISPDYTTSLGVHYAPVTVTIPKSAPALSLTTVDLDHAAHPLAAGEVYFLIYATGHLTAFGTLDLQGKFFVLISEHEFALAVEATLSLDPVGTLHAHGELHITSDGAAGLLEADFTTGSALSSVGISISGDFEVAFNTYTDPFTLSDGSILKEHLIRVEVNGSASLLSGAVTLTGRFYFEQGGTAPNTYTILEVSAHMVLPVVGTINVDGSLRMTAAGAVGALNASIQSSSALASIGITYSATLKLRINTTHASADDPLSSDPAVVIAADTVELDLSGSVTIMDAFTFNGHFYFKKSGSDLNIRFDATLNISVGLFQVTGEFNSTTAGFTGQLSLSLTSSSALDSLGFKFDAVFFLGINNTGNDFAIHDQTGGLAAFNTRLVPHHGLIIYAAGDIILLDTLRLSGTFMLTQGQDPQGNQYLEIQITAHLDLAGLVTLNIDGAAGIYSNGIVVRIALTDVHFGISGLFEASGNFLFELNTTGVTHLNVAGTTVLHIAVTGLELKFLSVLTVTGSLDISYTRGNIINVTTGQRAAGVFRLEFSAGVDFFGLGSITADGFFDSDGNYSLHIHGHIGIGIDGFFGIFGNVDFRITGVGEGITSLSGHIDGTAYLVGIGFHVDVTISWDALSGRLRASVSLTIDFFFFSVSFGGDFDIGYIKSTITYQAGDLGTPGNVASQRIWSGGALYVNVGARGGVRNYSEADTKEQVTISQTGPNQIQVDLFGKKKKYDNVTSVRIDTSNGTADPNDDKDFVYVDSSVTLPVFITTGIGIDVVQVNGSGSATINAGDGNDVIDGGSGNDTINGGNGDDILRGNGGDDTINGNDGADVIIGGTGVDALNGNNDNDIFAWTVGDGTDSTINGGAGTDSLSVNGTNAAETITVSPSSNNFSAVIGSVTLTTSGASSSSSQNGVEAFTADLQGGDDTITINHLASSTLVNVNILLGSGQDDVIIQGNTSTSTGDIFRVSSTADNPATTPVEPDSIIVARVASLNATSSLVDYHIYQGTLSVDRLTINGNDGDDVIDAHNVVHSRVALTLNGGNGNDTLVGSSFGDEINGGAGNDHLTGGPGVDVFTDTSGTDELIEYMDVNYTLNGATFTANGQTETLPAVFETVRLNGGDSNNTFTVSNFTGTLVLNGGNGSDDYNISIKGSGLSNISIADSGTGIGLPNTNTLRIYGTADIDNFLLRSGVISAGNEPGVHLEVVTLAGVSKFEIYGGDSGDTFIVDETTIEGVIYGEGGADNFIVGRILAAEGQPAPSGITTIDTTRGFLAYGNRAVLELRGGDGEDYFEVNHNQAELKLYGENGDDLFLLRTFLEEGSALSNVSGGSGVNTIRYVQNGPVKIDGGAGFDRLVLEGTEADDTFIVTDFQIFGGGRKVDFTDIESIVILGGDGNDTIWVLGNGLPLEIDGGSGNDTVNIGGQFVDDFGHNYFVYDAPAIQVDPPAYDVVTPVFTTISIPSFTIPGFFAFTGSFPFFTWVPAFFFPGFSVTVFDHYQTTTIDPPPVTVDPPPETYRFANVTNFNGVVNGVEIYTSTNSTPVIPGAGVTPTSYHNLGGIVAPIKVSGFDGGLVGEDDRLNINLTTTTSNLTGRLFSTIEHRGETDGSTTFKDPVGQILGLGLPDTFVSEGRTFMGGIIYDGLESIFLNLGTGDDTITIGSNSTDRATVSGYTGSFTNSDSDNGTFGGVHVTINGGNGNDTFNVRSNTGTLTLNGDANTDIFNLGSNAPVMTNGNLNALQGAIIVNGGTGTDSLNLDDRGDTVDNVLTLTQTTITGMDMGAGVTYGAFESLLIGFGSGSDIANVRGTLATTPTTLQFNDGDDAIYVSSTAAVTTATRATTTTLGGNLDDIDGDLTLTTGNGHHLLFVSDRDTASANGTSGTPAVITGSTLTGFSTGQITYTASVSGDFASGITVWSGSGADFINVTSEFLRTGVRNSTSLNTGAGVDTINLSLANAPNAFFALHAGAGNDLINTTGGSLDLLIFGGDGADSITTGAGNHLIFGDEGSAIYRDSASNIVARYGSGGVDDFTDGVIRTLSSATTVSPGTGGGDTITTTTGNDLIFGGAGADLINAGAGDNLVFGDHGTITLVAGLVTLADSLLTGGGNDTITTLGGRDLIIGGTGVDGINAGAGDNIVLGDHGTITLAANVVTSAATVTSGDGGVDTITTLGGRDFILGGEAGDSINAGDGDNGVAGDHGSFTLTSTTAFSFTSSAPTVGGDDTITTGTGADTIIGGLGVDGITAGDGRNVVFGDHGTVTRDTATGSVVATSTSESTGGIDTITTGVNEDVILGGAAGDIITSGAGADLVFGDSGAITITGNLPVSLATTTPGSGGDDNIQSGADADVVLGGDGADTINAGDGLNVVFGDYGTVTWSGALLATASATAQGTGGIDDITTGIDNDIVFGGTAGDLVHSGTGADVVFGDEGDITFTSGLATDLTNAPATGDGDDQIFTDTGDDVILGGGGSDTIDAGANNNTVVGDFASVTRPNLGSGPVTILITTLFAGQGGDDHLTTGDDNDLIAGGHGSDTIAAGNGFNVILGDAGEISLPGAVLSYVVTAAGDTGADIITAGNGTNFILGGLGIDHITTVGGVNVLLGDQGRIDTTGTTLHSATTSDAGTGANDFITTGAGTLWIFGGDGVDVITAGNGFAVVLGDHGRIDLTSGGTLTVASLDFTSGGNDTITTGTGNDIILGGTGTDTIDGGEGNNVVLGDHGQVVQAGVNLVSVQSLAPTQGAADVIHTGAGNDVIIGGAGADDIHAGAGRNLILGDHGSFTFVAGSLTVATSSDYTIGGDDLIDSGLGNDLIFGGFGADTITAGDGDNIVLGDQGTVLVSAGVPVDAQTDQPTVGAVDHITTGTGNDTILGGFGSDVIVAGDGNNIILGDHGQLHWVLGILARMLSTDFTSGGQDNILSGTGADVIIAGPDDDTVNAGNGHNIVFGDNGSLTWTAGILDLANTEATNVGGVDHLATGLGNDTIFGGTGNDTITAGDGNNLVFGDNGQAEFTSGIRARFVTTAPADARNDTITSGLGDDIILAGAGADIVVAGDGNNTIFADEGELTYDAAGILAHAISLATPTGAVDSVTTGSGHDTIFGGTGNDSIAAGDGNNLIFGDNGEATYLAGVPVKFVTFAPADAGSDTITSGSGNDTILAGAGADTVTVAGGNNVVFGDEAKLTYDAGGKLVEAVSITMDQGAPDQITTGSGNDLIVGGFGADTLNGGDGNNVVFGDNGDALYSGGLATFFQTLTPENSANDTISTGSGRDQILAGGGADTVSSGAGNDIILGDEGSITLTGGVVQQIISEAFTSGTGDTLSGGADDDLIIGGFGADHIDGGEGNNVIIGDNGVMTLSGGVLAQAAALTPAIGDVDVITTGAGNDVIMAGAAGDDLNAGNGDNVVIGDHATITFAGGMFATLTPTTPELGGNDTIRSGAGVDRIVGGTGADWIDAGDGDNVVVGDHAHIVQTLGVLTLVESVAPADGGVDLIFTGAGNDLVIGGTGGDTIHSGAGNDLVFGDHALVSGTITLALLPLAMPVKPFTFISIFTQNLGPDARPVAGDDVVFAGAGDDIVLGQQGADILFGEDGNDDLIGGHNVALGQDGADIIDGGAGYDVIAGDNAAILRTGDNLSPRAHVLAGDAMFDDRGNLLDLDTPQAWPTAVPERSVVILDHAFTTAAGLYGNDRLVGGAGDDNIFGELGADQIHGDATLPVVIAADGTIDRATVSATATALFTTNLWAGADSDGDDYIEGNGGNDLIFGGLGQDDIVGGSSALFGLVTPDQRPDGSDIIYGGNGTAASDESASDAALNGRARDADVIMGDNANIIRFVGINGVNAGAFLTFQYNSTGTIKIIVRGFDLLDYTVPSSPTDIGAADAIYGEAGDDTLHGEVGGDLILGNGNDDNVYGGQGDDNLFGGAGDDSLSSSDELKPPPPATSGNGPANNGTGASASQDDSTDLSGTLFFVPANVPAGIFYSFTLGQPQGVYLTDFFTGYSNSSPWIESSINQINPGGGSSWRIFSSGIFPSSLFGAHTVSYAPPPANPGFGDLLNPTGETPPPVSGPVVPPATPEPAAPPAPADGQNPPASDQPKSDGGTEPSGDGHPAASRD